MKTFEVSILVRSYNVYRVSALTKADAIRKAKQGNHKDVEQVCVDAAPPGAIKLLVREVIKQ